MEILELARKKLEYLQKHESDFPDKAEYKSKVTFLESILKVSRQGQGEEVARSCVLLIPIKEQDPFGSYFGHVIDLGKKMKFHPIKIDEEHFVGHADLQTEEKIKDCGFCIADVTEDNPNVYYEIGFASALGKPIIFTSCDKDPEHLFIRNRKWIKYKNVQQLKCKLEDEIRSLFNVRKRKETGRTPQTDR